jgi:integrase/recombinase XerD
MELPRLPPKLPVKPLSIDEAELVLLQPDVGTSKGLRDRAILEVLFATAIRRAELVNLRLGDIDGARGTLFVCMGKGGKQRVVPISERAIYWVNKYLSEARPLLPASTKTSSLFLTMHAGALTVQVLHDAVHGYIKSAEIGRQGSCHIFRHTVATLLLEGGADLRYVQEMLGHASPTTTQIYTRVTITSLKEAYEKAHPATAAPTSPSSDE